MLREQLGESQTVFGKRLGVSVVTIGRYETRQPPVGNVLMQLVREAENAGLPNLAELFRRNYEKELEGRSPSARAIKAIRVKNGWTQQDLARAADISAASVVRYETNGIPDRKILDRLSNLAEQSGLSKEALTLRRSNLEQDLVAFLATAEDGYVYALSGLLSALIQARDLDRQRLADLYPSEAVAEVDDLPPRSWEGLASVPKDRPSAPLSAIVWMFQHFNDGELAALEACHVMLVAKALERRINPSSPLIDADARYLGSIGEEALKLIADPPQRRRVLEFIQRELGGPA